MVLVEVRNADRPDAATRHRRFRRPTTSSPSTTADTPSR
jgi:hypothetical protein